MGGNRILLVGPRACGKTTLALYLAENKGYRAIDLDERFTESVSQSIESYVAANGWPAFRAKEHEILASTLANLDNQEDTVVSTGGGIVLSMENRRLLRKSGCVVYLAVPPDELVRRLVRDPKSSMRPKLSQATLEEEVRATLASRETLYSLVANLKVDATLPVSAMAEQILTFLAG
ncbi:MAG: AAA family ATPase [Desulfovibrionaceae bacterium]|nr:AAA family ATPase [Desulfovibrionaceae bacterium]